MLTLNQIHAQIEALANAHYQIAEVGMGTLAELQAKPDRLYPLLWLSNEGGSLEDNYKVDNIRLTMFGRVISGEEGQDDDASEIEVLSDMQLILLDFLNYFHQQHAQEYVVAKSASLEHFTERTNDRTAGYSCILELKQFYDWNKCQIPESGASISPSVDGLTLYDFCDQAVIDRLTPTQVACLEDEFGGTCAPAILTANSATFTTIASGGTLDIQVHDTADANVGTVASTSEIEIGNSSNEVNGVDISEPTVAEGTHNQQIQNSAATPVGTAANPSVIGDSQAQVNGVNTETIAATVTHNQQIQDSAGGSVGTAANPSVIGDNTINFNGADVDTVKAEETYSFLVELDSVQAGTYDAGTNTVSVTSAACADATTQVNAVNVGTVASGGTFDQQIHDSAGADVGTAANPSVIADSTIQNNATPTWTNTVKAEDTLTLAQAKALDSDGVTTLLADYIPAASGFMFTCSVGGGGSLAVGLSDATPNYGDTITITATPTGITPTSYLYFSVNADDVIILIAEQASNTFAWTVNAPDGINRVIVLATDGSGSVYNETNVTVSISDKLLDTYSGATVAYSLRLLRKAYAGALVLIRRSSDNAQKAFYPDLNYELSLDSNDGAGTVLSTWIGGDNGYIVTWYDQSGNGNDVTQATAGAQPILIDNGFILGSNGKAAISFDGTDDFLKYSSLAFATGLLSVFSVQRLNQTGSTKGSVMDSTNVVSFGSANGFRLDHLSGSFRYGTNRSFTSFANSTTAQILNTGIKTSTHRTVYIDSVQKATASKTGDVDFTSVTQHKLGAIGSNTTEQNFLDGFLSEIIVYNSDETSNRTGIETNINSNYNIY